MHKIFDGRYSVDSTGVVTSGSTGSQMSAVSRGGRTGYMLVTRPGWGSDFYTRAQTKEMYDAEHAKVLKIESIRKDTYIVGSKTADGGLSFTKVPKVHLTESSAKTEAARVAGLTPGTTFIVAKIVGEVTAGGVTWK